MSASFAAMATVAASTKRSGLTGGRETGLAVKVAAMAITPLDPIDPETRERLTFETPYALYQTMVEGAYDVREGDILVVGAVQYAIRSMAAWTWRETIYRTLIVEDVRTD